MSRRTGSGSPPCPADTPTVPARGLPGHPRYPARPAPQVHRREVGLQCASPYRTAAHSSSGQDPRAATGEGEPEAGPSTHPGVVGPARAQHRRLDGLGDPQRRRRRAGTASLWPDLARVPHRSGRGHHRDRLLPSRHPTRQAAVRAGVPRARHQTPAHHRRHHPPDARVDGAAGEEPRRRARGAHGVPALSPAGPRRHVRRSVRRRLQCRGPGRDQDRAAGSPPERPPGESHRQHPARGPRPRPHPQKRSMRARFLRPTRPTTTGHAASHHPTLRNTPPRPTTSAAADCCAPGSAAASSTSTDTPSDLWYDFSSGTGSCSCRLPAGLKAA